MTGLNYRSTVATVYGLMLLFVADLASGNDIGSNNGYGYGYSGSYSGTGNPPENFNFPHFDFNNLFSNFQRFQQDLQRK